MPLTGRPRRPIVEGTRRSTPAKGRQDFNIWGFTIGVLIGIGAIIPAMLLLDVTPSFATSPIQPQNSELPVTNELDVRSKIITAEYVTESKHDIPPKPTAPAATELVAEVAEVAGNYRFVTMRVTAYCPCRKCCGNHADGITASGRNIWANGGKFTAAPRHLPFGTKLTVPGYNSSLAVPVLDRGGAIKNNRLDVFFFSHEEARKWGVRWLSVKVELL